MSTEVPFQTASATSIQEGFKVRSISELDGFWRSGHTKLGIYFNTQSDPNGDAGTVNIYGLPTPGASGIKRVVVEQFTF
ncbi:MAG: hypothetical protein A2Y88_15305 [Chloroflexi bacterium RBG_13_48_10]|nr:MAG: hypothetical protein A2Y88_15305 [Chloroflexi bacterium RBG_13_48_10]